jgi:hypothetical protein
MGAGPKSPAALRDLTEVVEELSPAADGDQTVAKPVCLASSLAMGCVRFLPFSSSLSSANCPKSRARSLIAESILSPCELMIPRVTQKTGGCAKSHTTAFFYDEWSFQSVGCGGERIDQTRSVQEAAMWRRPYAFSISFKASLIATASVSHSGQAMTC